ncbi:MAG TPA: hypothetical protein VIR98_03480 [Candidatus Paceibacterota bacterium]
MTEHIPPMPSLLHLATISAVDERRINYYAQLPERHHPDHKMIQSRAPNFHKFLAEVARRAGNNIARAVWLRIWIEIDRERRNGLMPTLDLIRLMPDPDDRVINDPPLNARQKVSHYLHELVNLIES